MVVADKTIEAPFVVSAPGKAILFGEHAVVYGKTAIAGSLDMRAYALVTTRSDSSVRLVLPDIGVDVRFDTQQLPRLTPESLAHPSHVEQHLAHLSVPDGPGRMAVLTFVYLYGCLFGEGARATGFTVSVRSLLPVGSGLGSSAAYNVTLAAALLRLSGRPCEPDAVNEWAFAGEQVAHGTPSGIDNAVATYGGFLAYTKGSPPQPLHTTHALRVLVTNTNEPKSTKALVAGVRALRERYPGVVNPVLDAIHEIAVSAVVRFEEREGQRAALEPWLRESIRLNHGLLSTLGVSHPSLERIRETTAARGMASKLTGAGGGGCALTLVPADATDETVELVRSELANQGFQCHQTVVGSAGVTVTQSVGTVPVDEWVARMMSHPPARGAQSEDSADPFSAIISGFIALPDAIIAKLAPSSLQ
ncbi:Mevalonate kinase [Coemansia erecta]|nr:Mevalonate kinase [Coemansia sp. RSA 2618]KAJ2830835.1 Mevalonate kinase [Coemansia erecta]